MQDRTKYYVLYDLQIKGFKVGIDGTDFQEVIREGAERAYL